MRELNGNYKHSCDHAVLDDAEIDNCGGYGNNQKTAQLHTWFSFLAMC